VLRLLSVGSALLVLSGVSPLAAQKTDTLRLRNGDRLIGEIKGLSRALLSYSTDDLQTVSVEWGAVASLVSPRNQEVELRSGRKHYGRLITAPAGYLVVSGAEGSDSLAMDLVARIVPMSRRVVARLDGYVDLGLTYQQANHNFQFSFGSQIGYRGPNASVKLAGTYFAQDQDSVEQSSRSSLELVEHLFLGQRWIAGMNQAFERNEELDLEHRLKFGVGAGRTVTQTDHVEFTLGAGAVLLQELYTGQDRSATTVEGQFSAVFDAFRYNQPKLDLSTSLNVYPGISEWGRVRIDFDARISYELIKDFYLVVSVFNRYDSRPPSETAAKSDFGTTLSISWSF